MKKLLSNTGLVIGVAAIAVVASLVASGITCKWHWFGRSGALLTMAGVILSVRPLVRMGLAGWLRSQRDFDMGHIIPTREETEKLRQEGLDAKAAKVGVIMALVGTVIWAYGDLVGDLF